MKATRSKIVLRSKLKEIIADRYIANDYVHEGGSDSPFEYITREQFNNLSKADRENYSQLTQRQLAEFCEISPNVITELVYLRRGSINQMYVTNVVQCLGLSSISELMDFEIA